MVTLFYTKIHNEFFIFLSVALHYTIHHLNERTVFFMLKTVIYARYSSQKQNEQSIEGQIHECERFAAAHNLMIVDKYIDRALSGRTSDRPQFLQMIKDSASGLFDAVLVYKTDRFARNRYDSAIYKSRLKKNGVKIFYAIENITDTPEGSLLEAMLEGFAEYFSKDLSQKVKRGIRENVRKGLYFGGLVPYGYKIVNQRYVIDETQAPFVQKIFEEYANGRRSKDIYNELNKLPNYAGRNKKWTKSSFNGLLKNKKYIGIYQVDGMINNNAIPPIVSEELFYKAQARAKLKMHTMQKYRSPVNFILTTKLICGYCRHLITGCSGTSKNGTKHYYYHCPTRKCAQPNYRKDDLEDLIVKITLKNVLNPVMFLDIAKRCVQILNANAQKDTVLSSLQKQLQETDICINNLVKAVENGLFSSTIQGRLQALEQDKYKITAEIKKRENANASSKITVKHILFMLDYFYTKIVDKKYYDKIISSFINTAILFKDKIIIVYNLLDAEKLKNTDIDTLYQCSFIDNHGDPPGTRTRNLLIKRFYF